MTKRPKPQEPSEPTIAEPETVLNAAKAAPKVFHIAPYFQALYVMRDKGHSWRYLSDWLVQFNIRISHVQAEAGTAAGRIIGLPEMKVQDVVLTDVHIAADKGLEIIHADGLKFVNSHVTASHGAPVLARDAQVEGMATAVP